MTGKSKTYGVRLDAAGQAEFEKLAHNRGISPTTLGRIFILDGIRGYQSQNDLLLEKIESIQASLKHSNVLAAVAIAASAMIEAEKKPQEPGESPEAYIERYRATMKKHITGAITTGKELDRAFSDGKFD